MSPQAGRAPRAAGLRARGVLGLLVVVAACWGTLLAALPDPAGDPVLLAVSPADGEVVESPDEVMLTFDRPVPAGLATVRMTTPAGRQVVEGRPHNVSGDMRILTVPMPPTRYAGTYSVVWSTPSSRLEPISGGFGFHVFAPSAPVSVPQLPPEPDPVVVAVHTGFRLAATAALALGVGVVLVLAAVWPAGVGHAQARRFVTWAWVVLVAATLGTIGSLGGSAARTSLREAFDPALVSAAFRSDIGAVLLARLLVLVPITIALLQLLTGPPPGAIAHRWLRAAAVLGSASALAATWSYAQSHGPDGLAPLTVLVEVAFLIVIAVCTGGPVLLWLLLRTAGDGVLRAAVPRLARLMAVGGGLLVLVAPIATGGWQMIALLVLGALVSGTGVAGRRWVRRRTRSRGRGLSGGSRLLRPAAAVVAAVAVALLAAAAPATGHRQLAHPGWPAGRHPQIGTEIPDALPDAR
jgi:copper transport protein